MHDPLRSTAVWPSSGAHGVGPPQRLAQNKPQLEQKLPEQVTAAKAVSEIVESVAAEQVGVEEGVISETSESSEAESNGSR